MASQSVARSQSIAAFIPALERLIIEAMDEWKIPGLAVAVVQNGEVALLSAYGLRDVEAGLKVTTGHGVPTHVGLKAVHRHRLGPFGGRAAHGLEEAGAGIHPGIPAA